VLSASRVRRNSWLILIGQAVRMASTALVFVIVARVYGPVEFGSYTAAHTLATIFLLLADFGFDILLTWEVGRRQDQAGSIVSRYLSAKLIVSTVATGAMAVMGMILDVSPLTRTLMLVLSGSVFFSAMVNFFVALFRGIEQFQYETWLSLGSNAILLLGTGAAAMLGAPLWLIAVLFLTSRILAALGASFLGARSVRVRRLEWVLPGRTELRRIGVFGVHAIFAALFFTQDTLLLALWKGDAQVGVYQAAFKLVGLLFLLPDVLMTALFPSLAKSHAEDHERWRRIGVLLQKTLVAIGVSLSLVLAAAPDFVIRLVYGTAGFDDSIVILRIFSAAVFVHCATISFAVMLTTSGRHAVRMVVVVCATVFNFSLNAVLIPQYGTTGAAIASVSTLVAVGLGYVLPVRNLFVDWISKPRVFITLIAGVVLAGMTVAMRATAGWPAVPAGFILCAILMWHAFAPSERQAVLGRDLARVLPWSGPRP
jgi:O-antigen/teichoic acid export membrane protein